MTSPGLTETPNFAVRFEKMLSTKPKMDTCAWYRSPHLAPCLRDLVYQYFLDHFGDDPHKEELADNATKAYIEEIWNSLGQ